MQLHLYLLIIKYVKGIIKTYLTTTVSNQKQFVGTCSCSYTYIQILVVFVIRNIYRHTDPVMGKRVFGHMWTAEAQIRLQRCTVWSGPSLFTNRTIGYYRMFQWREITRWDFAHVQDDVNPHNLHTISLDWPILTCQSSSKIEIPYST